MKTLIAALGFLLSIQAHAMTKCESTVRQAVLQKHARAHHVQLQELEVVKAMMSPGKAQVIVVEKSATFGTTWYEVTYRAAGDDCRIAKILETIQAQ